MMVQYSKEHHMCITGLLLPTAYPLYCVHSLSYE